jgi:hypothetical protein
MICRREITVTMYGLGASPAMEIKGGLEYPGLFSLFKQESENVSEHSVLRNCWQKIMQKAE